MNSFFLDWVFSLWRPVPSAEVRAEKWDGFSSWVAQVSWGQCLEPSWERHRNQECLGWRDCSLSSLSRDWGASKKVMPSSSVFFSNLAPLTGCPVGGGVFSTFFVMVLGTVLSLERRMDSLCPWPFISGLIQCGKCFTLFSKPASAASGRMRSCEYGLLLLDPVAFDPRKCGPINFGPAKLGSQKCDHFKCWTYSLLQQIITQ